MLFDERLKFGYERTRYWNRCKTPSKFKNIAVGVAFGGSDAVQIHSKGTMALEDVGVVLEAVEHRGQGRLYLRAVQNPVVHKEHRHVVFLRFDVKQVVEGQVQVVAPYAVVLDCDGDALLLSRVLFQKGIQLPMHIPLVGNRGGKECINQADDYREIKHLQTGSRLHWIMK